MERINKQLKQNGIDLSKLPVKSQKMVTKSDGSRTLTVVLEWLFR